MTILHDEHKPKATPMTSDAVVDIIAKGLFGVDEGFIWEGQAPHIHEDYRENARKVLSALSDVGLAVQRPLDADTLAKAICDSRGFETGEGTCAARCMDQLGSARGAPHGCQHATKIHARMAANIVAQLENKDE